MPNGPTSNQLREWYKRFSETLLKNADIDVTNPKHLGLIKNIQVTKWDTTNPDTPDVKIDYAYASESAVPFSDAANTNQHAKWLSENLKPDVTNEQILRLYNMSQEGTLMISSYKAGISDIRMVYTDPDGKITVSQPASVYRDGGNNKLPADDRIPDMPVKPASSLKPEDYNIPSRPVAPPEPANMHPGFWSWLGDLLGMDTDYTKLKNYELAMSAYEEEAAQWDLDLIEKQSYTVTNKETNEVVEVAHDEYRLARYEHEQYAQQLEAFQLDPMGKFSAIANSLKDLPERQRFWATERGTVAFDYTSTPLGKARKELDELEDTLGYEERTDVWLHNWWGHDADPSKVQKYSKFTTGDFQVKPLELPKSPNFDQMSTAEQADHSKYMSDLFDLAVLSTMGDPEVTGQNPKPGRTNIDEARNRFGHVFNDMVTQGRSNVIEYLVLVDPTREKAMKAMEAYAMGEKGPLAEVLGRGMRELLLQGHNLKLFTSHSLNTPYVIGKMYNLLQQDPDLLKATGLKEDELQDVRAHMELYQVMRQGLQAKKDILDHALEKRTLTSDELKKAAEDILLFHHVMLGVKDDYLKNEADLQAGEEYNRLVNSFSVPIDPKDPSKGMKSADAATIDKIKHRLEAMGDVLPPNKFTLGLLDKNGVTKYMNGFMEKANLNKIGDMSREELKVLFSKSNSEIVSTLIPAPKPQAPEQNAPEVQVQKQAEAGMIPG